MPILRDPPLVRVHQVVVDRMELPRGHTRFLNNGFSGARSGGPKSRAPSLGRISQEYRRWGRRRSLTSFRVSFLGTNAKSCVARALICEPRLILVDEPTGQLDSSSASKLIEVLIELASRAGAALLIATHDPAVAGRMQTRLR